MNQILYIIRIQKIDIYYNLYTVSRMKTRSGRVLHPINITLSSTITVLEEAIAILVYRNRRQEVKQVKRALAAVRRNLR